jgi:hypothetical protein
VDRFKRAVKVGAFFGLIPPGGIVGAAIVRSGAVQGTVRNFTAIVAVIVVVLVALAVAGVLFLRHCFRTPSGTLWKPTEAMRAAEAPPAAAAPAWMLPPPRAPLPVVHDPVAGIVLTAASDAPAGATEEDAQNVA